MGVECNVSSRVILVSFVIPVAEIELEDPAMCVIFSRFHEENYHRISLVVEDTALSSNCHCINMASLRFDDSDLTVNATPSWQRKNERGHHPIGFRSFVINGYSSSHLPYTQNSIYVC